MLERHITVPDEIPAFTDDFSHPDIKDKTIPTVIRLKKNHADHLQ